MSYVLKEVVDVEHVPGCERNKGCSAACRRTKRKGEWEAHISIRIPGKKTIRRRPQVPPENSRTATERNLWAETEEKRLREELAGPKKVEGQAKTVAELMETWMAGRIEEEVDGAEADARMLRRHVLPLLGSLQVGEVGPRHAYELVTKLKKTPSSKGGLLAPRTVRGIYFMTRQVFEDAYMRELIPGNPIKVPRGVLPKREDKDPAWRHEAIFTAKEVELLISSPTVPEQRRVLYAIEFLAGLRTGQVSALRWGDYDPDLKPLGRLTSTRTYDSHGKKVKARTKTRVPHLVPVHPVLAAMLADWKLSGWRRWMGRDPKENDLLVPTKKGASRDSRKSLAKFHQDLVSLGLRKRRHYDTRRTFISIALDAGASKDILQEITHPRPADSFDLYRTASWEARCKQVSLIPVQLREGRVVPMRVVRDEQENGARMAPEGSAGGMK